MIEWLSANSEIIIIVIIAISQACCFLFGKEKTAEKLEKEKKKLLTRLEKKREKASENIIRYNEEINNLTNKGDKENE